MDKVISKLIDIKEDVDAIYHHQSDRIVAEIEDVIRQLKNVQTNDATPEKTKAHAI